MEFTGYYLLQIALQFPYRFWDSKIQGADYFGHIPPIPEKRGMFSVFYDMDPQVACVFFSKNDFAYQKNSCDLNTLRTLLTVCAGEAGCAHVCDHWGCSHGRPGHGGQGGGGRVLEGPAGTFSRTGNAVTVK